ncbi:MAG: twin-arginine translocase subunit TatB [Gammaproteobacteria bacterium]|nr:twin-arginine translocase subunit TatB [Gammaproteobacteria bacterium]
MFDVGFWELLIIAGLGLLILGPERLPRVVGQLGRWLRQARRTASQLRWQIEHELDLSERRDAERKREQTKKPAAQGSQSATASDQSPGETAHGHHGGPASDADEPVSPADAAPVSTADSAFPEDPAAPADTHAAPAEVKPEATKPAAPASASADDQRKDATRGA